VRRSSQNDEVLSEGESQQPTNFSLSQSVEDSDEEFVDLSEYESLDEDDDDSELEEAQDDNERDSGDDEKKTKADDDDKTVDDAVEISCTVEDDDQDLNNGDTSSADRRRVILSKQKEDKLDHGDSATVETERESGDGKEESDVDLIEPKERHQQRQKRGNKEKKRNKKGGQNKPPPQQPADEEAQAAVEEVDNEEDSPEFIPKQGNFYQHDRRAGDDESRPNLRGFRAKPDTKRWVHDRFDEEEQAPKSTQELIEEYGYDIRSCDSYEEVKANARGGYNRGSRGQRPFKKPNSRKDRQQRGSSRPAYNNSNNDERQNNYQRQPPPESLVAEDKEKWPELEVINNRNINRPPPRALGYRNQRQERNNRSRDQYASNNYRNNQQNDNMSQLYDRRPKKEYDNNSNRNDYYREKAERHSREQDDHHSSPKPAVNDSPVIDTNGTDDIQQTSSSQQSQVSNDSNSANNRRGPSGKDATANVTERFKNMSVIPNEQSAVPRRYSSLRSQRGTDSPVHHTPLQYSQPSVPPQWKKPQQSPRSQQPPVSTAVIPENAVVSSSTSTTDNITATIQPPSLAPSFSSHQQQPAFIPSTKYNLPPPVSAPMSLPSEFSAANIASEFSAANMAKVAENLNLLNDNRSTTNQTAEWYQAQVSALAYQQAVLSQTLLAQSQQQQQQTSVNNLLTQQPPPLLPQSAAPEQVVPSGLLMGDEQPVTNAETTRPLPDPALLASLGFTQHLQQNFAPNNYIQRNSFPTDNRGPPPPVPPTQQMVPPALTASNLQQLQQFTQPPPAPPGLLSQQVGGVTYYHSQPSTIANMMPPTAQTLMAPPAAQTPTGGSPMRTISSAIPIISPPEI